MSGLVHESVSLMVGSIQNVSVATASATSAAALPAGATGFRIAAGCAIYLSFTASATANGAACMYVPANTVQYFDSGPSKVINLLALTSANPMAANITPYSA